MQIPLELAVRDVAVPPELEQEVRRYVSKLDRIHPRISSCRVAIDRPHNRRRTGDRYRVRVDMRIPGRELTITRRTGETPLSAVQAAFSAAARRLEGGAEKERIVPRQPRARPARGRVMEIQPLGRYGFLESADGRQIYFDARAVLNDAFDRLTPGTVVKYTEESGNKGPQASTVSI